jgi:hypothetical protein
MIALVIALVGAMGASPASACPVPVFRYALENWQPSVLDVVVAHNGDLEPLSPDQTKLVDALALNGLAKEGSANIFVRKIDLNPEAQDPDPFHGTAIANIPMTCLRQGPQIQVYYRGRDGAPINEGVPAWSGQLSVDNVKLLLDSPVRRQVVSRIFRGDSVVWLVVDGGNKTRDDKAAAVVSAAIAEMNTAFVQPASQPDVGNGAVLAGRPGGPPLRLALSMVRISADDPAERIFVAMLRHTQNAAHPSSQPDEVAADEPIAVPLFGRGRTLGVVREADLTGEAVQAASDFLCGECSCQSKEQAAGVDLLIAADWESAFSDEPAKDAPPLRGLGAFLGSGQPQTQPAAGCWMGPCAGANLAQADPKDSLWRNIFLAIAGLAAVGVGLPFVVLIRRRLLNSKSQV